MAISGSRPSLPLSVGGGGNPPLSYWLTGGGMGSDIYSHLYTGLLDMSSPWSLTIVYVVEGSGATWAGLRILLYCLQQPSTTYYGTTYSVVFVLQPRHRGRAEWGAYCSFYSHTTLDYGRCVAVQAVKALAGRRCFTQETFC